MENPEKLAALKKAMDEDGPCPLDFWGNKSPRCPHCGKECDVSENEWWYLYEEGEHEVSCPYCDEDFTVSTSVSYRFSTDNQEE